MILQFLNDTVLAVQNGAGIGKFSLFYYKPLNEIYLLQVYKSNLIYNIPPSLAGNFQSRSRLAPHPPQQ